MAKGTVVGGFSGFPVVGGDSCQHEIDDKSLPEWSPKVGKLYTCVKCGAKVFKEQRHIAALGTRIRMSKKERRRRKLGE